MTPLENILIIFLVISVLFNVGLSLYTRGAIVRLLSVSEELGDLQEMVNSFARHTSSVYQMEMFYGDETLQSLMNHAISFNEQLETFEYIYSLTAAEEQEGNTIEDENEKDSDPEEETQKESLLY
jgi:hypothetical protein